MKADEMETEEPQAANLSPDNEIVDVVDANPENGLTDPKPLDAVSLKGKHKWPLSVQQMPQEMQLAYGLVKDLAGVSHRSFNWPFVDNVDCQVDSMADYEEVVKSPTWLRKILERLAEGKYESVTQVIGDLRLMLENCYRYHGPDHSLTKKGLLLEQLMEEKLATLPKELQDKTKIEATSLEPIQDEESARRRSLRHNSGYHSLILYKVRNERADRDRVLRKKNSEVRKAEREGKEKEVEEWEEKLTEGPVLTQMKAMWELPQIGHFLFLCQNVLNTPEVPQYELERVLIMPRQSVLLSRIMTSLLTNHSQRLKLDRYPPMPYKIWHRKLLLKMQTWYKVFVAKEQNSNMVFGKLGIEPTFFRVLGSENPLDSKPFHGLTFHQRVWILKGLCDNILHRYKGIQDVMNDQLIEDLREYSLGIDSAGNSYLHFPQFCGQDLRVYRQSKWIPPSLPRTIPKIQQSHKKTRSGKILAVTPEKRKSRAGRPLKKKRLRSKDNSDDEKVVNGEDEDIETEEFEDADFKPCVERFELVVDSVEALRELIAKFEAKPTQEPRSKRSKKVTPEAEDESEVFLVKNMRNLLAELEPWDQKLQQAMRRTRQRLRKEYEEFMLNGVIKHEQNYEAFWKSDSEDEEDESSRSTGSLDGNSNPPSDYDASEDRRRSRRSAVKKKSLQVALKEAERKARQERADKRTAVQDEEREAWNSDDNEDDEDDEEVVEYTDVSSRGRVRKIRTVRAKSEKVPRLKAATVEPPVTNGNAVRTYQRKPDKTQAWESLRQIFDKPAETPVEETKPLVTSTPVPANPSTQNRIFTSKSGNPPVKQTVYIITRPRTIPANPAEPPKPAAVVQANRPNSNPGINSKVVYLPKIGANAPPPVNVTPKIVVKPETVNQKQLSFAGSSGVTAANPQVQQVTTQLSVVCIEDRAANTKKLGVLLPDGRVIPFESLVTANGESQTFTLQIPAMDGQK